MESEEWGKAKNRDGSVVVFGDNFYIPLKLLLFLNENGRDTLNHVFDPQNTSKWAQGWLSASQINIPMEFHDL